MIRKVEYITDTVIALNDSMFPLYIIKGKEKNYLIDCGISARAEIFYDKIKEILDEEKIDAVLLTHSHYDHTGACSYLQDIFNFKIYGSVRAVELLNKFKVIEFINKLNQEFNRIENIKHNKFKCSELKKLTYLHDNETIAIDEVRSLTAVETKGHTQCSMSYFLLPDRILFPGDASGVLEKNGEIKPLFLSSYNKYIESINKLITLDAEILALPHNRFISGKDKIKRHLENSITVSDNLKSSILQKLNSGNDIKTIAGNLLPELFAKPTVTGPQEAFKINLQAMVKTIKKEFC